MSHQLRHAASLMEPEYAAVLHTKDWESYRQEVIAFSKALGFDRVNALLVTDRTGERPHFETIDNSPDGFASIAEDPFEALTDPVMQYCKHHSLPIVWNQKTYLDAGQIHQWEAQAPFGYRCGIALAMHLPFGRHYMVGIDRDKDIPTDAAELTRIVAALQLFVVHAYEAASQLSRTRVFTNNRLDPELTARELESLRLTAQGKTAAGVAAALGISSRTAAIHLMHATRKMRCANKLQAAVNAVRMGLVTL